MWAKQEKGLKQDNEAYVSERDHAGMPFVVEKMKNIALLHLGIITKMCEDNWDNTRLYTI